MKKILFLVLILFSFCNGQDRIYWDLGFYYYYASGLKVYAVDLNGSDEYMKNESPVNLDLNDTNRIALQADIDFEDSLGNWTGAGNHSIDTTSVDPLTGSYSGEIISTGAGDVTTNYAELDNAFYTVPEAGKKYTFQFEAIAPDTVAGDSVYVYFGVHSAGFILTEAKQTLVTNFEAAAGDTLLFVYLNTADTIRIDEVDLSEAFDMTWQGWINNKSTILARWLDTRGDNNEGWDLVFNGGSDFRVLIVDAQGLTNDLVYAPNLNDSTWHHLAVTYEHINTDTSISIFLDGVLVNELASPNILGVIRNTDPFTIGIFSGLGSSWFNGSIGEVQIIRGILTDAQILEAKERGEKGKNFLSGYSGLTIISHWKFGGNSNADFLSDETGNNDLTGVNVTQSDDQIKLKKYED